MSKQNLFIRAGHDASKAECEEVLGGIISDNVWKYHTSCNAFLCKEPRSKRVCYLNPDRQEYLDLNGFVEVFPEEMEILL